jgi:hypothetical protein
MRWLVRRSVLSALFLVPIAAPAQEAPPPSCPVVTAIRFQPAEGQAGRMVRGRFTGSNEGETVGFATIAEVRDTPPDGRPTTIRLESPARYRWLKYEAPPGSAGAIAEVEFLSGDHVLKGTPFGTAGTRDGAPTDFAKALDGDPKTHFEGADPNGQYAGIDLGSAVQPAAPTFDPPGGAYETAQAVTIRSATPGATVRISQNGGTPARDRGEVVTGPVRVAKGAVLAAVAYTADSAESAVAVAPYRIGAGRADARTVRTFHIGNSLTDTVDNWLANVATASGRSLDFHRFTIPGAPTDWLWDHPASGFGDSRYAEAFVALAPIDHLFLQPFAGHARSVENEADYGGRFAALCREQSPRVQVWLYAQWPDKDFRDAWSRADGSAKGLGLTPARTWADGAANHRAYIDHIRKALNAARAGATPVRVVPAGDALARLKAEIDAGRVPGQSDLFAETFSDDLHLNPKGRYLVALVFWACLYGESPEGTLGPLNTGLTDEQARIYRRIAWETVQSDPATGVGR